MLKDRTKRLQIESILIALLPIFSVYMAGTLPISFGDLGCIIIVVISLFNIGEKHVRLNESLFILFFAVSFAISNISILLRGQQNIKDSYEQWLRIIVYYYVIDISSRNQLDILTIKKCSVIAGNTVSLILLIQVFLVQFLSLKASFLLHFIPLNYGGMDANTLESMRLRAMDYGAWRPTSVFLEPAHFAQFVCLPLIITLFDSDDFISRRSKVVSAIIISSALFLSQSANGIFMAVFIWGAWLVIYLKQRISVKRLIVFLSVFLFAFVFLLSTDFLDSAFSRLETMNSSGVSTGTQRLLQGLAVYGTMSLPEKIFGIGFGNIGPYLIENNITTEYLSELGNEYMNAFSTILVSGGMIGFIFYIAIWIKLLLQCQKNDSRMAMIVLTFLFFTSALFLSCTSVMYLSFIICSNCAQGEQYGGNKI